MHDLKALVAPISVLEEVATRFVSAVVCPLVQGFALVPISDSFAQELKGLAPAQSDSIVPDMVTGVATLAAELSLAGPVAFVSTEYFGGEGGQDAVVWKGLLVSVSLGDQPDSPLEWPNSPVSQALRLMGVVADAGKD